MANANFNLNIKTKVDSAELNQLKQQLQEIRNLATNVDFTGDLSPKEIQAMTAAAHNLEKALDAAFDPDLNTVNIQKFNQYLNKTGLNVRDLQADLALAGVTGQQAFVNATTSLLKMGTATKQTSVFLDKMATTMANTVRWNITSGILNTITGTVERAVYYIEDLDTGLNDIRIVTGKSADEMQRFAESANNAAKALAVSTEDYVEGSLIYYQQGLDDETVQTLTEITAMTSNVTGQSMRTVSEQLTAVWNGYQVANQAAKEGMGVYQEYVDKMAAVGAATASDLEELATAMSKVASAANAMGIDFDQLSAQIATIVSVTRQAPESVGTALKTIYARIGDLKIDGVDEFGVTLGEVSGQLEQVGIKVMDQSDNLREVGPIMEEVASKWNTWNEAQQQSIAIAIAGKRQYNNLLALFENWDMYTDTLNTAANAAGTLDEQQSIALESLENKLEKLSATAEDLYDSLLDEEGLKDLVDAITPFVQGLADAADAIGGLKNLLPLLGSLGVQVFNKQLTQSVLRLSDNLRKSAKNAQLNYQELSNLSGVLNIDAVDYKGDSADVLNSGIQELKNYYAEMLQYKKYMTTEDENQYNLILKQKGEIINSNIALKEQVESWKRAQEFASNRGGNSFTTKISGIDKVEDFKKLEKAVQEYNNGLTGLKNIQAELTISGMDNVSMINIMSDAFDAAFSGTDVDIQGFKNEFNQLNQALENNEINVTEYDNALVELFDRMKNFPQASQQLLNNFGDIDGKTQGLGNSIDILKQKLNLTKTISQITSTIGAVGQLTSALQTFKNIGTIWENEDLSDSEKMLQTIINLSFVLPNLVTAFTTLNKTLSLSKIIGLGFTMVQTKIRALMVGTEKATKKATAAQRLFNAVIAKNPLTKYFLIISSIVAIFGLLAIAIDKVTVTLKEQAEIREKAVDDYKELEEALKDLESQLESTKSKLKELYNIAQEDLSVTDKEEIALLEAKTAQLEAQVEAQKQLAKEARKIQAEEAAEFFNKGGYNNQSTSSDTITTVNAYAGISSYIELDDGTTVDYNMTPAEWEQFLANKEAKDGKIKISGKEYDTSNVLGYLTSQIIGGINTEKEIDIQAGRDAYIQQLLDNYNKYIIDGDLQAWKENNETGQYSEQIAQAEQDMLNYYKVTGKLAEATQPAANLFKSQKHLENVVEASLDKETKTVDESAFIAAFGKNGVSAFEELQLKADALGLSMYDLITSAEEYGVQIQKTGKQGRKSFEEFAESAQELHVGMDALKTVYLDVKDGGTLDFSKVLDNKDFVDSFSNLDAYEEFLEVIVKSPDDIEACQEAFNNLSAEYLETTGILENLSEETKDTAIALLEQEGIVNASEVVDHYLGIAGAVDELTAAKNKLGYATTDLEKLEENALEEILETGNVSEYAKVKIYELYLTQALLNDNPAETQKSVENLINLMGGAEAAGVALVELADIMRQISDIELKLSEAKTETDKAKFEKDLENLEKQAAEISEVAWDSFDTQISIGVDYEGKPDLDKSTKKDKKRLEDEFDRYWELNKALEKITETISDLDKRQSHLHSKELINSLKQENELLEEQANRYKAINAEQMREADELRQKLASTYAVSFDVNGGIANYAEATTRMLNWYNNNLNDEVAQESYENFKKLLERYETLYYEEMVDVQNQLDDIFYQQLENNLKAWETDLEINLELEEAEREWSDFTKAMQDDFKKVYRDINRDFANIMEKMSSYGDDGTINLDIQAIQDVVREIEKLEAGGMSDMFVSISEAQEKLKELQGTLMDDAEAAHDLWVEAWEAYLEGIDQAADKFDDLMDKFDTINEELEFQRELTELLYGDQAYDIYANIYQSQLNNSIEQIKSIKEQHALWQQLYNQAEEGSEEQLKYYELMQEAQSELNDKTLEHIKLLQEERNNLIDQTINALDKSLTGGLGIDKMREEWEDAQWAADRYFDNTERLYELETLANKYNDAISKASTLESQQKLKELMDGQLADLEAKEKLTEYDIVLAEKRLSIAQAEIALQDAQNAKDSMKLVRGANGNWEYQYVADENEIANKQQQLLDAYKGLYDFVKKTEKESVESIINMTDQFYKDLSELKEQLGEDTEEFAIAAEELYNEYYNPEYGKISILMSEHAQYERDLNYATGLATWGIYQQNEENYKIMTDNQKALVDEFRDHSIQDYFELDNYITATYDDLQVKLETTTQENLETWNSAAHDMAAAWNADDGESVRVQVQSAIDQIIQANEDYKVKIDEVADIVQRDFSEDGIKGAIDDATIATNLLEDATIQLCNSAISALSEYKSYVAQVENAWNEVYSAAQAALQMSQRAASASGQSISYSNNSSNGSSSSTFNPSNGGNSFSNNNGNSKSSAFIPLYASPGGGYMTEVEITKGQYSLAPYRTGLSSKDKAAWPYYYRLENDNGLDGYINETSKLKLDSLDTGGYTGEWSGGEGRLAMLHSKELVLNTKDTENILNTVQAVRDLGSVTSSIGSAIISNIKTMLMDVMGIKAGINYHTQQANTATNNTFEIYAEFPNANDVTSIREAILSLPNLASQYTSQNKK